MLLICKWRFSSKVSSSSVHAEILLLQIISRIMKAQELNLSTINFTFNVILSVCHEIIHTLVGAVSASKRPQTSTKMTPAGHAKLNFEASGWRWVVEAIRGIALMFQDQTDLLRRRCRGASQVYRC